MTTTASRAEPAVDRLEVDGTSSAVASFAAVAADVMCLKRDLARHLPAGVHLAAVTVLSALDRSGPERMSDVAERLRVDLSAVSRHVRSLEDRGLLERRPDPADGRSHLLVVTAEGRERLARIRDAAEQRLDAALRRWSDDDVRQLRSLLDRLHTDLRRADHHT
ncbi:hypothetical protein GCM10027446_06760 [Angustibacter peucedani]